MKFTPKILFLNFLFAASFSLCAQTAITVYNDGIAVCNLTTTTVSVVGNFQNQTNGSDGSVDNQGTGKIFTTGNWTNNATGGNLFTSAAGIVELNGVTAAVTVGGTRTTNFYDLIMNNTFGTAPQISLGINTTVRNTLTMTTLGANWNVNQAGFSLTIGTSAASPGSISHGGTALSGWCYGGNFVRFIGTGTFAMPTNSQGLFPIGSSAHFRPFWLSVTNALSTGGSVSLLHTADYTHPVNTAASHTDASWGAGTVVQEVSNSIWDVSTSGVAEASSPSFSIRYGGFGFRPFVLTDVNSSLLASTVGTYAASTNANVELEANRTALSLANLNGGATQSHRLGTRNSTASPLPVELLSFDAKLNVRRKVDLKWVTVSEINNDYFTIEKTKDGVYFEQVVVVDGAGNSNSTLTYKSVDENPYIGISYYRLKQTDFDGKYSYSQLVPIEVPDENGFVFGVYPNPTNTDNVNVIFISTFNEITSLPLTVIDVNGRMVYSEMVNGVNSKEVNKKVLFQQTLASGIYLIKAEYNGKVYSQKLIIN